MDNNIKFTWLKAGFEHFQETGKALPEDTINALSSGEYQGAIFGAVSSPSKRVPGYSSPIVQLRKKLDLYANIRPIKGQLSHDPTKKVDLLIVRENTEGLYVKKEELLNDPANDGMKMAIAQRIISEKASRRIGDLAFKLSLISKLQKSDQLEKPRVVVVHKANVLSISDGVFREAVLDEAKKYGNDIDVKEQLVDSMVYRIYRDPFSFDVCVAPNMYGDILSDAGAALVGSLGVVAGANYGDSFIMAEPVHGSAPDISGKNIANPIACIRSAAILLDFNGESARARAIYDACDQVISEGKVLTPDLGGSSSTDEVTEEIIRKIIQNPNDGRTST